MWSNGWSIFPQQYSGDRKPGIPKGQKRIAFKTEFKLHQQLPAAEDIDFWADPHWGCPALNIAGVPGDTAGEGFGWFSLDLDIYDAEKISKIVAIAEDILGVSPLRRGRASVAKLTIIYRRPAGALTLPSKRFVLEGHFDGKDEVLEIQDDGVPTTFFGRHHDTGEFFIWGERSPLNASPSIAPVVDEEIFVRFIAAVHAAFPIRDFEKIMAARGAALSVDWLDTDVSELRVPSIAEDRVPRDQLTDGRRQKWLLPRSAAWAVFNAGIVAPLESGNRAVSVQGVAVVAKAVAQEAAQFTNLTEGKAYARARALVRGAAQKIVDGTFKPIGTQRKVATAEGAVVVSKERLYPECNDAELTWLPRVKDRYKNGINGVSLTPTAPTDAELAAARALISDRAPIRERVSRKVRLAIRVWIRRVAAWNPESGKPAPRLLIKAPTGAGKTTALIQELVKFKQEGGVIRPILMLLPSYENTNELEAREDLGVWTMAQEARADEIKAKAGRGISVMTFKGKIAAGCEFKEMVQLLMSKRISTAGLCRSKEGDGEDVYCKYNPENPDFDRSLTPCQSILQKMQVPQHDLILAPHAFIQTSIPEVLKKCVAVVIDEKIWDKTLGSYSFNLEENLRRPRGNPEPTKTEKKAGIDTLEYLDDRQDLVDIVLPAIRQGRDVSLAVLDHVQNIAGNKTRGGDILLQHAKAITGRAQRIVLDVKPGMSRAALDHLCKSPLSEGIVEEHKLWSLIEERLNLLVSDREALKSYNLHMKLYRETKPKHGVDLRKAPKSPKLLVRHDRDHRIIYLAGAGDQLTVTWRKKRNFEGHPTLFLDASGRQEILEKIWGGKIQTVTVNAPLHVRTVLVPDFGQSKASILPDQDDNNDTLLRKATLQTLDREALYTLGLMHGDTAVVACAPKDVRVQLNSRWAAPANMHWMHFGNVRGLDFAKHHGAAVSIGSVMARDTDIDAYVAALTHDDDEVETLNDPHGNGRVSPDPASSKIARRYISRPHPLRDGGTALVDGIPEYAGHWAQMLQQQIREEELAQFAGRLRPVYREGEAPVWYVLGRVLPEGTVVDDIVSLRDLARPIGRDTRVLRTLKQQDGVVMNAGHTLSLKTYLPHSSVAALEKLPAVFAKNPRMTRGFHLIAYLIEGEEKEHVAWVSAANCDSADAVARFVEKFQGGMVDEERREYGRPVLKGIPRLARAVRMQHFGRPQKLHAIDEVLGSLGPVDKLDSQIG